jgi:signal transduction histidine kinase
MLTSQPQRRRPVLIVADDLTFINDIREPWQKDAAAPELRIVGSSECMGCRVEEFQFVVVGGLQPEVLRDVLTAFRPANVPLIVIGAEGAALGLGERHASKVLVLPACPNWQDLLVALGAEVAHRAEAQARARRSEMAAASLQCEAALGRYVIEMRHNLNNALTSVLGNAELLLLDETKLSGTERKQIETIRVMAVRMHETLQRFSSLEKELRATGEHRAEALRVEEDRDSERNCKTPKARQGPQLAQAAGAD